MLHNQAQNEYFKVGEYTNCMTLRSTIQSKCIKDLQGICKFTTVTKTYRFSKNIVNYSLMNL